MERLTRSESSEHSEGAPTWLPDGKSIVFANIVCESPADSICRVHRVDLETRRTIDIPGSDGLRTARVSPDGRFLAAQRESTGQILLYSFGTGRWSELATRVSGDDLAWTRDSGSIFGYTRWAEEPVLLRISVRDHRVTRVTSLSGLIDSAGSSRYWMGLDDQDRPLLFHSFSAVEVYSAEINQ